jgi:hypothetical protein
LPNFAIKPYRQRAGAEKLIKEANNDAGLAAHPSARWYMNCVHFQLAMMAYNLNCWLILFNRDEQARAEDLKHTTLATARLRYLFLAAKMVAPCRCGVRAIQRSLHRTGNSGVTHESTAFDRAGRSPRAGGANAAAPLKRVHRILCKVRLGLTMTYEEK